MNIYNQQMEQLYKYFADLVIVQYRNAPENRAFIKELVDLIFANNLLLQIKDNCVDLNKSVGAQLDVVGKWLGIDRYYDGVELWSHKWLSFPLYSTIKNNSYSDFQGGFSTYSNFADNNGGFLMYSDIQDTKTRVNAMGDNFFRPLCQLKAIKNSINHTCKNIDDAIYQWSNGEIYTTWGTMSITYHYPKKASLLMQLAQYKNVLLAPTGCSIILEEI